MIIMNYEETLRDILIFSGVCSFLWLVQHGAFQLHLLIHAFTFRLPFLYSMIEMFGVRGLELL